MTDLDQATATDLEDVQRRFRYPMRSDEDLPALARLAYRVSATECKHCRNYHVYWPYLRSIGANGGGPEADWDLQVETLAALAGERSHVRWLLAGSADSGLLALVAATMGLRPAATYDVTVIDRCATPLALCRAYADDHGIDLATKVDDLQSFEGGGAFDVVLMHRTMGFIPQRLWARFLTRAGSWLAPQGRLVLTLSLDRPDQAPQWRPNASVIAWRTMRVRDAIASGELDPPEDAEVFVGRFDRRRDESATPSAHRFEDYDDALAAAGLTLEKSLEMRGAESEALAEHWARRGRFIWVASRSKG